ncbi:hypothetical protein [Streptomyces sp. SCSIO ZS0520]|uniref:hypothetical protein n=1 Tax=Streptomyces sp. SCSIO ZS0520 TaxID=2892996 RepID=UPI0021DB3A23|nr:hypothetical protein [Streptomyces sp. SCSIO ZS0520]
MNHNPTPPHGTRLPLSPHPLRHLTDSRSRVLTAAELRAHGVSAAEAAEQCRPEGPWRQLLPGVFLLHTGPPTGAERLQAVLLYAGRAPRGSAESVPAQPAAADRFGEAALTGLAALACHGFASAPPPASLDRLDVLVPRGRRLRSTGCVRLVRTHRMPGAVVVGGVPLAPVARAAADAVARLGDGALVRALLTEAVREGHAEASELVRELTRARLLGRPHVTEAVDALLAEGRTHAEHRLYRMVREQGLPDPLWNVDLRLPGGPHLGGVDAYWPDHAVALELRTAAPARSAPPAEGTVRSVPGVEREHLERLGIAVVHADPGLLREHPARQAAVVRTALLASADREPVPYVVVLPR